ncbi:hypothetical protein R3P38DRAFT_3193215 [Favolaschia claudopus]|uniref:Uncharacterized protein n=1 Tax=Favolaschia claudopus TaxID=2862362 RepID=A0AAW0BJ31_9AGAR
MLGYYLKITEIAPVPTYTVPSLKGLLKPYLTAHPELCLDDNYAALFTKKERKKYLEDHPAPPPEDHDNDSSRESTPWAGIQQQQQSRAPTPAAPQAPLDLDKQANLQLLESLPADQIERALQVLFPKDAGNSSGNPSASTHPSDSAGAALLAQKRPERIDGLVATSAGSVVPEAARKRFAEGWKRHVPLNLLSDEACAIGNRAAAKEFEDSYTIDGTRGIVAVAKEIPMDKERALNFTDWFAAWQRLLDLIRIYVPLELQKWQTHFTYIHLRPPRGRFLACLGRL